MLKRWWIPAALVLLAFVPFISCNKSEGNKIQNFFGAPPQVSEVSITKERKNTSCTTVEGSCTDTCDPGIENNNTIAVDFVTATAKVVDPTKPTTGTTDILVVVLRFLDPPPSTVPPGTQISQISLEMFDSGPVTLGTDSSVSPPLNIYSGDQTANDGIYTRKFYFATTTSSSTTAPCYELDDQAAMNHTFSTYTTARDVNPSTSLTFTFTIQAIDNEGNIATSTEFPLAVQGSVKENIQTTGPPCGAPNCPGSHCTPNDPPNGSCDFKPICQANKGPSGFGFCCGCAPAPTP